MDDTDRDTVDLTLMEPIYEKYRDQPGAIIPMLQSAQEAYGYLPSDVIHWIAERLDVAPGKVHGVATFYSQFALEGQGKHVLKLCDGTACHVKGSRNLAMTVEGDYKIRPGETTEDGELTVEIVYCMGSCALAPVAVLDDQVMGRMRPEALLRRLKQSIDVSPEREV
jgi:NADH-quinone oxidoreductase subunit E